MKEINNKLKEYIENSIFPEYQKNEEGHSINHINYVIERSIRFASTLENINLNLVYTIAAFHDIAHYIDKDNHEILSAKIFYSNEDMKAFFSDEERSIIKEAIEDHRASSKSTPRSEYGKIVSTADRNTSVEDMMKRIHSYTLKHHPNLTLGETIDRGFKHATKKYGQKGYAKVYFKDVEYDKFLKEIEKLTSDKELFRKKYIETNNINIKEKAKEFAINAHHGQIRKSEKEKPMVIHPISVAKLLEEYGYDDNVVAAGYLHDVVEDTKYTLEDIEYEFGKDIASLVEASSEPDKSLSWEERKLHTIETAKSLSLRKKLVLAADKINNLEDLAIKFAKVGKRDFSSFKRGEKEQKWYYTNIYQSLIYNEDENLPIFQRLKNVIDIVFEDKKDIFLEETIFYSEDDYYKKLKKLHASKIELQRLKKLCELDKPFVIEFTGTPRTGKTTIINNLFDYFKKGNFTIKLIEEFTTSQHYKEELKNKWKNLGVGERNLLILEETYKTLTEAIKENYDIILIDRGLYDRQIWNLLRYQTKDISKDKYFETREKYLELSKMIIDYLIITYTDSLTSLRRDYINSLSLEPRNFLNLENIENYNQSLNELQNIFIENNPNTYIIDTTNISPKDTSIEVTSKIMPVLRRKYIDSLNKKYTTK